MFDKDYELKGKHATYTKFLCNSAEVFKRFIDVYMLGAVMGFLHGRKAERDLSTSDDAMIFAGAFNTERLNCEFIYRLIMLLDITSGLSEEQRINRAFREGDSNPEDLKANMNLFHAYVFGGIEVLYEKFAEDCTTKDDYINKIYEIITSFKNDIDVSSYDELIKTVIK